MMLGAILFLGASLCLAAPNDTKKATPPPPPRPAAAPARPAPAQHNTVAPNNNQRPMPNTGGAGGFHANPPVNNGGFHANPPAGGAGNMRPNNMSPAAAPRFAQGRAPVGANRVARPNGDMLQRRPNGRVSDVHNARLGMDVHHGLMGGSRVEVVRPGGVRIVAERGRPGFVAHPFDRQFGGHAFAARTYYYHGRPYERFYRTYGYHGMAIEVFAPAHYYSVGFYGWAYHPWGRPVAYAWGWGPSPWYGYYGGYFAPYPTYAGPNYWLTDYMIANDLQAEYQANMEANTMGAPMMAGGPMITPEVKQQISAEVANQIALENYEAQQNAAGQDADPASSGIARMLSDGRPHVFVAGSDLDVVNLAGQECALTPGDVLQFNPPVDPNGVSANLVVLASKGGPECRRADTVAVALNDLQEMQNQMRQTIDDGLAKLQAQQGQGGLPPAPPSAQVAPSNAQFTSIAPPPDPDVATELSQQESQAATAETEVSAGS